ncbi:alpha/beta fold hydrolase [Piscinibacter gummiphilus]|uniref:Alpha/beta fold hydrolase n=1 Tax=Piscinibacter gummiphilus TaxID=946333 RepID=A0ABZ0CWA4_9BURK|nr:alpha/beta fold hydrolase [Piscinibacter gummiphilus]WOB07275.1 alpha/beta fold hydrolase [Piscinibacter gummiphilus]
MKPLPAQPLYFGPEGSRLFGWLHLPAPEARRGLGVVVCNPFGFEEVCAHRSLRQFAMVFSAAGWPSLRFDHAGCGDSEGDEFEPDVPARWLAGVNAAIDTLKAAGGVQQVVLFGVRLGATLAALAGMGRDDVGGLVSIAPVVRGRGYIRELTMLGQGGSTAAVSRADVLESAGFVMTRATEEHLSQLDLRRLPKAPAPRVLIIPRDDLEDGLDWQTSLKALGADVQVERLPGYADMMQDPQRTVPPQLMMEGVIRRVQMWDDALALRPVVPVASAGAEVLRLPADAVTERPVHIATSASSAIFGVLTEPEGTLPQRGRPAVLMLNSGAVHHIGPNRLWTRLARQWAARGVTVLRIDLSGVGDSPARPGAPENVVYSAHAMQDVTDALAYLRGELGADECHLLGLCSGGYHAFKAAVAGQPVVSSTVINPLTYFWHDGDTLRDVKDYELAELTSRYRDKVFTREPWLKLLRGQLDARVIVQVGLRRTWGHIEPYLLRLARRLRIPLQDDLADELSQAVRQGIRLRFVFAARAPGYDLLRKQGGSAIDRLIERQLASLDFVPDADHTFTRLEARERLVALLDRLAPVSRAA